MCVDISAISIDELLCPFRFSKIGLTFIFIYRENSNSGNILLTFSTHWNAIVWPYDDAVSPPHLHILNFYRYWNVRTFRKSDKINLFGSDGTKNKWNDQFEKIFGISANKFLKIVFFCCGERQLQLMSARERCLERWPVTPFDSVWVHVCLYYY